MGGNVARVEAVGNLGWLGRQISTTNHTRKAEYIILILRSVGGDYFTRVEATGHLIVLSVDASHHASHSIEGIVVFLYIVRGDIAGVRAVGDGDLAGTVAIGDTYPTN